MKTMFLFSYFLLILCSLRAQPQIAFSSTTIDYGIIPYGSDGMRSIWFYNVGNEDLVIESLYSSCGCLLPSVSDSILAPGDSASYFVVYDTERLGVFTKTAAIVTNELQDWHTITCYGEVLPNTTALEYPQDQKYIKIFPSIASTHLNIEPTDDREMKQIAIVDFAGKSLYKQRVFDRPVTLDIGFLSEGLYMIMIETSDGIKSTRKFMKR